MAFVFEFKNIKYLLFMSSQVVKSSLSPVTLASRIVQNFSNLFDPVQVAPLGMQVLA